MCKKSKIKLLVLHVRALPKQSQMDWFLATYFGSGSVKVNESPTVLYAQLKCAHLLQFKDLNLGLSTKDGRNCITRLDFQRSRNLDMKQKSIKRRPNRG